MINWIRKIDRHERFVDRMKGRQNTTQTLSPSQLPPSPKFRQLERMSIRKLCLLFMMFQVMEIPLVFSSATFSVTPPCTTSGSCFQSKNYPSSYGSDELCTITVNAYGYAHAVSFDVEEDLNCDFDSLAFADLLYCGEDGPSGVKVTPGDEFYWTSDESTEATGFKICINDLQCVAGNYLNQSTYACEACPAGSFSIEKSTRCAYNVTSCPSGTYAVASSNACRACPRGRISKGIGKSSVNDCKECPGSLTSRPGSDSCFQNFPFKPDDWRDLDRAVRYCLAEDSSGDCNKYATSMWLNGTENISGSISEWDTSKVQSLVELFGEDTAYKFNQNISNWDVSSVTTMKDTFQDQGVFNSELGTWDVAKVANMYDMFYGATSFNTDISSWNVAAVTNMAYMLYWAEEFNQPLLSWDVSRVSTMRSMFQHASLFNQDISGWDVGSVTQLSQFLFKATSFNQSAWCSESWEYSSFPPQGYEGTSDSSRVRCCRRGRYLIPDVNPKSLDYCKYCEPGMFQDMNATTSSSCKLCRRDTFTGGFG